MSSRERFSLTVREIQEGDIQGILSYWLDSDSDHLKSMGVDLEKIPPLEQLQMRLRTQLKQSYKEKVSYCTIWEIDGEAVGHCNVSDILYGKTASMHLHMWANENRGKGCGLKLVAMSLPWFFNNLELEYLICEPYALNPAPNKTIERLGFEFVKEYETIPGSLNFMQPVKQWRLSRDKFKETFGN
ncbi:MAG: GNAT family N-acetyltransferase [Flavobacteriales bacterium]|nr:GNAT family N-acetyltransferase [Flavobacteriales bacterium]